MQNILNLISSELATKTSNRQQNLLLIEVAVECLNSLALRCTDYYQAHKYLLAATHFHPYHWKSFNNLCHIQNQFGRFSEAVQSATKAKDLCPSHHTYFNLGIACQNNGQTELAISHYRKALEYDAQDALIHYNLAWSLLKLGQYEEGWREYEWRLQAFPASKVISERFQQPMWDGNPKKSVCIYSCQGLGDFLMFMRYLPHVKCKKLVVECQEELVPLLTGWPVAEIRPRRSDLVDLPETPDVDAVLPICGLPGLLKIAIPPAPYLTAQKKVKKLASGKRLKVGICHAGSSTHAHDFLRSLPLRCFQGLAARNDLKLYSFFKDDGGPRSHDLLAGSEGMTYEQLVFHDLGETAGYLKQMDLVICADSVVGHLAGALNVPCWLLLSEICDWRHREGYSTSEWYTSWRLFRQKSWKDWSPVFQELEQAWIETFIR